MKKRLLNFSSLLVVVALPFASFGCSFDPNAKIKEPERKITSSEIEEGSVFFIESLFNTNYFRKILNEQNIENLDKQKIINFAKKHPQLESFNEKTIKKINDYLDSINFENTSGRPKISLKIQEIDYSYQFPNNLNEDVYSIDNDTINVNIDNLNSFEDIFNVFDDIWNIKNVHNDLAASPYTKIYDYQFKDISTNNQNFLYLEKRAKVNNIVANIYDWNFKYKINFQDQDQNSFTFKTEDLEKDYNQLLSLVKLYSDKNYSVETLDNEEYQIIKNEIPQSWNKKPNFAAYPTINLAQANQEYNPEIPDKGKITFNTWNPVYVSSILPKNSYVFYEEIISNIYNQFYDFSNSTIFKNRVETNFDKTAKIYQYQLEEDNVKYIEYQDYKNAPIEVTADLVDNQESRSYLEYMLTQWLYNTKEYVEDFEKIEIEPEDFDDLVVNISKENNEKEEFFRVQLAKKMNQKLIIESQNLKSFKAEEYQNNKLIDTLFQLRPRYGYRASWLNRNSQPLGLRITKKNNTYQAKTTFIKEIKDPKVDNIFAFNDGKLSNPEIVLHEGDDILDLIDVENHWLNLQKWIDEDEKNSYKITDSKITRDTQVVGERYKGTLEIDLNLENSNLYIRDNDKQHLSQKIHFAYNLRFHIEPISPTESYWDVSVELEEIRFDD